MINSSNRLFGERGGEKSCPRAMGKAPPGTMQCGSFRPGRIGSNSSRPLRLCVGENFSYWDYFGCLANALGFPSRDWRKSRYPGFTLFFLTGQKEPKSPWLERAAGNFHRLVALPLSLSWSKVRAYLPPIRGKLNASPRREIPGRLFQAGFYISPETGVTFIFRKSRGLGMMRRLGDGWRLIHQLIYSPM